jgi:CBS domain containing-hemolysin-like protein
MEIVFYIIILVVFYFLAWLFNGFETGIISIDRFQLEQDAKKDKKLKRILDFYDRSDLMFGTALIGNNVSNVIIAMVSTMLFVGMYEFDDVYSTIVTIFAVLVFCQIIPKNLFRDYPRQLVSFFFPLVYAFCIILRPAIKIVTFIQDILKKIFKVDPHYSIRSFSKDDLEYLLDQTHEDGHIETPQKEMLEDALDFNDLSAKNVMTPRIDIIAIPDTMAYPDILKFIRAESYTRYPVYHETLDEITGVLIVYDLLNVTDKKTTAKQIQRDMFFVPESIDVNALLRDMQTNKKSIAVVVDSFGGTAGIVTVEDILEEIVGDIDDEYDVEESSEIVKIGENTWIVNALIKVVDLNEELEINLPEGEYETLAGLVIHHLARIPSKGQKITIDQYKLEIIETTHRKINKVKLEDRG